MPNQTLTKSIFSFILFSLTVSIATVSMAAPPVNSTIDGRIIPGGTFYNTADSSTTFTNNHSTGLWLQRGVNVRGLEVNANHSLTNNGGSIHLNAPGQVVRVDGNINVNANTNGSGAFLGNGGNVSVDSAYLYQNGKITGLGNQGGHMTFNVNSATFGPLAKVDVVGGTNGGGTININASGVINIQKGAVLDTTGVRFIFGDSNEIDISGSVVNNEGIIKANGISSDTSATNAGIIRLLTISGSPNLQPVAKALANDKLFNPSQNAAIYNQLQALANCNRDSVRNTGSITADGGTANTENNNGGNGGTIIVQTDSHRILNLTTGVISANGGGGDLGGRGGYVELSSVSSSANFQNAGQIQANGGYGSGSNTNTGGVGGAGGNITLGHSFNTGSIATNTGNISANGGPGSAYTGGRGGVGGTIQAISLINKPTATISVIGGSGSGQSGNNGGAGGNLTVTNLTNNGTVNLDGGAGFGLGVSTAGDGGHFQGTNVSNTGTISATGGSAGGKATAKGGLGGRIKITNLTNSGLVAANGGSGNNGGDGGVLIFTKVNNTGTLTANGGDTFFNVYNPNLPAGDGGIIITKQVVNTGKVQALGGKSGSSPSLNGQDGTVIGF